MFIFSILLYLDLNRKVEASTGKVVGKITYRNKTIQRKYDSQVVWDDLEQSAPLTNRDSIRSADQSEALITLNDGTEIQLSENSMILLDFSGKDININFAYGSVQAKRSDADSGGGEKTALNIKSGEQTIKIDNSTDVKLAKNADAGLSLTVDKGQATVNQGGKDQVVGKDQQAELGKDKIDIKPITLKIQNPPDQKHIVSLTKESVIDFRWEQVTENPDITLEVSQSNNFAKNVIRRTTRANNVEMELKTGIYYWRISAKNKKTNSTDFSETRKFSILKDSPVLLFSPGNRSKFGYVSAFPVINFSWNKNELSNGFKLEISGNADFSNILKSFDAYSNSISIDSFGAGTYYWRVSTKPSMSELSPQQSGVQSFVIENKKIIDPPSPLAPDNSQKLNKGVFEKGKALFIWQGSNELKKFRIQISSDSKFKNIVFSESSGENFINVNKALNQGSYFWRVKGITGSGQETEFSEGKQFQIGENEKLDLVSPNDRSDFDFETGSSGIEIHWKRPDQYGSFSVEFSTSKDFQKIAESRQTTSYSATVAGLNPGTYFWRVRLLAEDKSELLVSAARSIRILEALSGPVPLYPANNEKIDMAEKDSLKFTWEKADKARSYTVEILQNTSSGQKLILREDTKSTNLVVKDLSKLDEGEFTWTLRANYGENDSRGKQKNPVTKDFSIILSRKTEEVKPSEIEIISPKHQFVE